MSIQNYSNEHLDSSPKTIFNSLSLIQKKQNGVIRREPENTASNFLTIFQLDPTFSCIRYNQFSQCFERVTDSGSKEWGPEDDAWSRGYIEENYHIRGVSQWADAFCQLKGERGYNPIKELVESTKWDGTHRCEFFLTNWMKADDSPYVREVSRLLFAGGIHRLYSPGCKFDCVPVLQGNQGSGKSTICRWLALNDRYYASIDTVTGQKSIEGIRGSWICELEELLAVVAAKPGSAAIDKVKAFVSGTDYVYREPYTKRSVHHYRQNVFIGTTNRTEFNADPTGGRRWFPVRVHSEAADLYDRKEECHTYIRQAWAEMLYAYNHEDDLASLCPSKAVHNAIQKEQAQVQEEDYRIGLIEDYLKGKNSVCLLGVYNEGLGQFKSGAFKRETSLELAELLVNHFGWERGNVEKFALYGKQKAFHRPKTCAQQPDSLAATEVSEGETLDDLEREEDIAS